MKMPNDTQSDSSPTTYNDITARSPHWLVIGVIGIVLCVVIIAVVILLFLFRRKILTKCMSEDSESTSDNIDQRELTEVRGRSKTKDDTVIEEDVIEMTVNVEVLNKSRSPCVNCDIDTTRYVGDPTKNIIERKDPNPSYDNVVKQILDARNNHAYDYVDQETIKNLSAKKDKGYMNKEGEVIDNTQTDKAQTIVHKNRKKKLYQNAPTVGKSGIPIKSDTKCNYETSKRSVGRVETRKAEGEATKYQTEDVVNPSKKNVDMNKSTEMTSQSDVYVDMNQTSCFQSQAEKHLKKRKDGRPKQIHTSRSLKDKHPLNSQQKYENVDLKNTDANVKGTERESLEFDYENISDLRPTSSVSIDSNASDLSSSSDKLHENRMIYKPKSVNILIKMHSVRDVHL